MCYEVNIILRLLLPDHSLASSESRESDGRKLADCGERVTKSKHSISLGLSSSGPVYKL